MAFKFQQNVGLYNDAATAGDRANQNPTIYAPTNFLTGGAVNVGGFVWRDATNPETEVVASTSDTDAAPLGFMERVINFPNYNQAIDGTLTIPEGCEVNVAVKGDFYVVADGEINVGDKVYANTSTGAATFDSTGGAVDTGFTAFTSGDTDDLVIISNWA